MHVVGASRVAVGGWSLADVSVIAATIAIVGVFEWVVHLYLLHAPEDSRRTRILKTGTGHRRHHLDPHDLDWLLLRGIDALVYLPVLALFAALLAAAPLWLAGAPILGPYLTMLTTAYVVLTHYEWTHLRVHARYRPKTRRYARLARNHRLHHYRNEHYWLGVTSNSGDRLLRSLPASKADVPVSDTARTLSSS